MFILLVILVALAVLGHLVAKSAAEKIRANPDPYPYATISQPPQGETSFILREDGTKIHAISAGKGADVVLAHGYGVSSTEWNLVFNALVEDGYRVITFDQRGHGQSTIGSEGIGSRQMADDYKAVLEHFDVHDAILIGHSMGGFLSIVFTLTYPEIARARLKGLILFAATAGNVREGSPQNRIQIPLMRSGFLKRVAQSDTYGWLFGASIYGDAPSPAGIRVFLDLFIAQPHLSLIPIVEALADEDYYPRLAEIDIPAVVICGRKDKTTPPWHSERMGIDIPNVRAIWVDGKGHMLNWEAPDVLVDAVRSF